MANKRMAKKAAKKAVEGQKAVSKKVVEVKPIEIKPLTKTEEAEVVEAVAEEKIEAVEETVVEVAAEEVKEEVAAEPVEEKKPRAKRTRKPVIKTNMVVQAGDREVSAEEAIERATADWCSSGFDRADLKEIAVYVKPEESAIFYVINGSATGRVEF